MSTVQERIAATSAQHTELLRVLEDTALASEQLEVQHRLIDELRQQLCSNQDYLHTIRKQREQQVSDRNKQKAGFSLKELFKCFHNRRWKEAKESQSAYFETLRAEHRVSIKVEAAEQQLKVATEKKSFLEDACHCRTSAWNALHWLYESVFDEDNPFCNTFEREAKRQEIAITADCEEAKEIWADESTALEYLRIAAGQVEKACVEVKEVRSTLPSRGGDICKGLLKARESLARARASANLTIMWIGQAQGQSSNVHSPPEVTFVMGGDLDGDVKDDIDIGQPETITADGRFQIHEELVKLAKYISEEIEQAVQRANEAGASCNALAKELQDARETLRLRRRKMFGEHGGWLPRSCETCDRKTSLETDRNSGNLRDATL